MDAPDEHARADLAETDRHDRRNRRSAQIWAVVMMAILLGTALARHEELTWWYIALVATLGVVASLSHWKRFRFAGWAFVVLVMLIVYVPAVSPQSMHWRDVVLALTSRLSANGATLTDDAGHFKDAYVLVGSAAFTLYGFFFLATRRVERVLQAVRLFTIAQVFATVLGLAVTATLRPTSGWWRYALIVLAASGAFIALSSEPRPYIVDVSVDRPGTATFWDSWLRNRRGQTIVAAVGLFLMPMWPVVGELIFVFGLLYLLLIAAQTATYLFLSTELPNSSSTDQQLSLLYGFKADIRFANTPTRRSPLSFGIGSDRDSNVTAIEFVFPRAPQPPQA